MLNKATFVILSITVLALESAITSASSNSDICTTTCNIMNACSTLFSLGKKTKSNFFPSKEKTQISAANAQIEQMENTRAQKDLETFQKECSLRQCLMDHRHSTQLGVSGIPETCESAAKVFRLLGGSEKTDEIITSFKITQEFLC